MGGAGRSRRTGIGLAVAVALGAGLASLPSPSGARTPAFSVADTPGATAAPGDRVVALTFDDGPDRWGTTQTLAVLARYGIKGTFFVTGQGAAGAPDVIRQIAREGSVVAGHGWRHTSLTSLSDAELTASVSQTDTTLRDLTGYAPPCMRPPYGAISPRVVDTLARAGKTAVLWSVDPFDWKGPGVAAITSRVLSAVRPGAIVLLHPGSGVRAQTVAALPGIIEGLQARGYRFVSLCGAPPKDERTVIQADSFGTGPGWPGTQLVSNTAIVGAAATATGHGAWVAASDGGVFAFGDAVFAGSLGGRLLNQAVVGMAATPSGRGYWLVAADGGVFAFGDAVFAGSLGGRLLNQVVVGMAATPSGRGYWLVAADGGVFAFGDAVFHGSGAGKVTAGVVSLVVAPDGQGYWLVSSDGAVLARGGAPAVGSLRDLALSRPVVAGAASPTGQGLWLVGGDGGIFALGDAAFTGARPWTTPGTVAVAVLPTAGGYWVVRGTPVAAGGP